MYYYFLFRKIIFSLLVLVGIGVIILLVRFYWGGPEEQHGHQNSHPSANPAGNRGSFSSFGEKT